MTETWRRMTSRKKGELHKHTWESEYMRHVALPARRMYSDFHVSSCISPLFCLMLKLKASHSLAKILIWSLYTNVITYHFIKKKKNQHNLRNKVRFLEDLFGSLTAPPVLWFLNIDMTAVKSPANDARATTRTSHPWLHLGTGLKRALHAPLGLIPWPSKAERGIYHTKCFGLSNSDKPHKITETREGRPSISLTRFKHGANALEVNFISDSPITLKNENTERHQQNNFNLNKKCKFGTNNVTRNKEN